MIINDPALIQRAEILREKGTNRRQFFRGQVDKYTWVDIGSSFLPSDLLASFLLAQLEQRQLIQDQRQKIWMTYQTQLNDWAQSQGVHFLCVPEYCEQTYHIFCLLMPTEKDRDRLILYLKENGILSVFHYQPLHLSKMGQTFGGAQGQYPVCEKVSGQFIRLPIFFGLKPTEQQKIIDVVKQFVCLQ